MGQRTVTIMRNELLGTHKILVGESVYENAEVTLNDGKLFIEFETDDLDSIMLDLDDAAVELVRKAE